MLSQRVRHTRQLSEINAGDLDAALEYYREARREGIDDFDARMAVAVAISEVLVPKFRDADAVWESVISENHLSDRIRNESEFGQYDADHYLGFDCPRVLSIQIGIGFDPRYKFKPTPWHCIVFVRSFYNLRACSIIESFGIPVRRTPGLKCEMLSSEFDTGTTWLASLVPVEDGVDTMHRALEAAKQIAREVVPTLRRRLQRV